MFGNGAAGAPAPAPAAAAPPANGAWKLSRGGFAARRSEDPRAQLVRQQEYLKELERKPESDRTSANRKLISNTKVFMTKLKLKMLGRPANNNGPGFLSQLGRPSGRPSYNFTRSENIWKAGQKKLSVEEFTRGIFRIQRNVSSPSERLRLLREMQRYGPKNSRFREQLTSYISNAERNSSKKRPTNNGNRGRVNRGPVGGGQQIIMGPQAGPAGAPGQMAWGVMPPPQISVKVNAPKINLGARGGNMGGVSPAQQRMNLGSPALQANLVRNAGGPAAVRTAVTALKRANGNVNAAMNATGLPRQTFANVKNLGGVNAAPRIVAAVVRRKRTTTHKKPKRKTASVRTNRLKKVVHKVPRKNLEKFVLLWALRKKK